ncbi:hypothetical protein OKW40_001732 [Paraburkholderia sp. RAU6.4a]|uniref:hypothetical protein n=1 Tax=Paraburkholderia sp. RAU6.4a TaxID=2991067 RepID=UPI003D1F0E13
MLAEAVASSHEEYHWKQHHGSSWGAFLSLLKFVRESVAVDMFRKADPQHLKAYFHQRLQEDGLPLIGRFKDGSFSFPNEAWSDRALNFLSFESRQFLITESIFNDTQANISTAGMISGENIISQSMEDATHSLIDLFNIDVPHERVVSAYEFAPNSCDLVKALNGRALTSHAIAEGAATIQEFMVNVAGIKTFKSDIQMYTLNGDPISLEIPVLKVWRKRLAEIASTDYGIAFGIYLENVAPEADIFEQYVHLATFLIVADLALNPPLPPTVIWDGSRRYGWHDIYPPHRFGHLLHAVRKIGIYMLEDNNPRLSQYRSDLIKSSGLPDQINSFPAMHNNPDFSKIRFSLRNGTIDEGALDRFCYYDYVLWMNRRMFELRQKCPQMLIFPPAVLGRSEVMALVDLKDKGFWYHPQIYATPTGVHHAGKEDMKFHAWWLRSVEWFYVQYDLVAVTGPLDLSAFPHRTSDEVEGDLKFVRKCAHDLFGTSPW